MTSLADIAVAGGSALCALLEDAGERVLDTPPGASSDPVTVATAGGPCTAFLH